MTEPIRWRICATCGLPKALSEFRSSPSCHKCHDRTTNNRKRANPSLPQGGIHAPTQAGEAGIIHSFEKDELYIKLLEMGCVPGEPVKVVQVAPLGDPISIEVSGYHLSLRLSEADSIIVSQAINNL